jgi:hypothetical protein
MQDEHGFIWRPIPASSHAPSFPAGLEYFYDHKVMLRFTTRAA